MVSKVHAKVLVVLVLLAVAGPAPAQDRFGYLQSHLNTYPDDALFNLLEARHGLKALVGQDYGRLRKNFAVVAPTEEIQGYLVANGCMAHNCWPEKGLLAVNLTTGKLTVGILSDCRKITIYSQEGLRLEQLPGAVQQWVATCRRECGRQITPLIIQR
ncbi:MAG: hypothetical protein FJ128_05855 [Deltaproteobacteria bacterium]|nr:hypothetical protein [Deltaproteobacteria bacterium]